MDSPSLRSVAADANVLLSAAIGKAAQRVFHETSLVVVTTEEVLDEVREYLAELAVANGLTEEEAEGHLAALPIEAYPESAYRRSLPASRRYLGLRDPDDVGLAALALHLGIPVWSNDKDFRVVPVDLYPTAKLLKVLGL